MAHMELKGDRRTLSLRLTARTLRVRARVASRDGGDVAVSLEMAEQLLACGGPLASELRLAMGVAQRVGQELGQRMVRISISPRQAFNLADWCEAEAGAPAA